MSFSPRTEIEKLLCGVSLTPRTRLGKAIKQAMDSISSAVELPVVSGTDNGKLLGVSSGKWNKVDAPTAGPFEIEGTVGQNENEKTTFTFAETAAEMYALCITGRRCKIAMTIDSTAAEYIGDMIALKVGTGNSAQYTFFLTSFNGENAFVLVASGISGTDAVVLTEV